ncbi:MAG: hypothetical protein LBR18_05870 [Tannerella sp.]|jgi:hypothetical protein|nr:hypothetical protein [Tannerella sp.]
MYRILIIALAFCGSWALAVQSVAQKLELMKLLPERFDNYKVTDWLDYEGEALYDYINGGAELYMSYGLKGMTGAKYNGEGLPQITVEVYEMTSAPNAYGVFTQGREKEQHEFGQGSQRFDDFIIFWKERYYVAITTQKPLPESQKAMSHLAALLDKGITKTGSIPAIIGDIPQEDLAEAGYLYFHHYVWLNAYLFIADYNIVNISDSTDAILAKYGPPDARCYLLMVDYPTVNEADTAFKQLKDKFAPEKKEELRPLLQIEDGTWFSTWTQGKRLCAVFNGITKEQTEKLYNNLKKN